MKNPLVLFTGLVLASLVALILVITLRWEKTAPPSETPSAEVASKEPALTGQKPPENAANSVQKPALEPAKHPVDVTQIAALFHRQLDEVALEYRPDLRPMRNLPGQL